MAILNMTDTQDADVQLVGRTRKGNVAAIEGLSFESSDVAVVTVTQDATDKTKAVVSAVAPGTATVTGKADADPSDGVVELIGVLSVVIGAGQASVVELTPGVPREQPAGSPGTAGAVIAR